MPEIPVFHKEVCKDQFYSAHTPPIQDSQKKCLIEYVDEIVVHIRTLRADENTRETFHGIITWAVNQNIPLNPSNRHYTQQTAGAIHHKNRTTIWKNHKKPENYNSQYTNLEGSSITN